MEKKQKKSIILIFIIFIIMICFFEGMREELGTTIKNTEKTNSDNTFKIISSTENKDIEEIIQNYAKKNRFLLFFLHIFSPFLHIQLYH